MGAIYELLSQFEKELNQHYAKSGKHVLVHVGVVPTAPEQLIPALLAGQGDFVAGILTVTEDRMKEVDFADPFYRGIAEIVVTGPASPPLSSLEDLSAVHEITPSSPVWSGKQRLGEVVEVQTDDSGALIDFVLDRGFLRSRVRVPAGRVVEVIGNNVHVDLTEEEFQELPPENIHR